MSTDKQITRFDKLRRTVPTVVLTALATIGLSACGDKESKPIADITIQTAEVPESTAELSPDLSEAQRSFIQAVESRGLNYSDTGIEREQFLIDTFATQSALGINTAELPLELQSSELTSDEASRYFGISNEDTVLMPDLTADKEKAQQALYAMVEDIRILMNFMNQYNPQNYGDSTVYDAAVNTLRKRYAMEGPYGDAFVDQVIQEADSLRTDQAVVFPGFGDESYINSITVTGHVGPSEIMTIDGVIKLDKLTFHTVAGESIANPEINSTKTIADNTVTGDEMRSTMIRIQPSTDSRMASKGIENIRFGRGL